MKPHLIFLTFSSVLFLSSCGSTRVNVERPAAGTQTTITVTTNNPITTEVNPTTTATIKAKGTEK